MAATAGQSRCLIARRSSAAATAVLTRLPERSDRSCHPAESAPALSAVEVEGELGRVRPQPDRVHLVLALVGDPRPDQVVREHPARGQELVVALEGVESLSERAWHLRDRLADLFKQV